MNWKLTSIDQARTIHCIVFPQSGIIMAPLAAFEFRFICPTSFFYLFIYFLYFWTGPGCSSVAYGVAEEVGPFHINPDGKSVYLNPHSWNQG
jgi:Serine carboxypeptidase